MTLCYVFCCYDYENLLNLLNFVVMITLIFHVTKRAIISLCLNYGLTDSRHIAAH